MDESTHRAAIPVFRPQLPAAMRHRLERTLDSGWIGYGPECRMLEAAFTAPRGGWALATSSCTSALYLAGRLIQRSCAAVAPEIIVPSVTFVASTMAFLQAGMRPVLAEVDPQRLFPSVYSTEQSSAEASAAQIFSHMAVGPSVLLMNTSAQLASAGISFTPEIRTTGRSGHNPLMLCASSVPVPPGIS